MSGWTGRVSPHNLSPCVFVYYEDIHWVERGTGTPKDRDEVNWWEVWECDGWVCDLETIGGKKSMALGENVWEQVSWCPWKGGGIDGRVIPRTGDSERIVLANSAVTRRGCVPSGEVVGTTVAVPAQRQEGLRCVFLMTSTCWENMWHYIPHIIFTLLQWGHTH